MKLSGIIIAGGKSSRMGTDKTRMLFNDKTLLEHAIDLLKDFTDEIIVSINREINMDIHTIKDEIPGIGPIGGLYTTLKNIRNQAAIVIPVDTPLLSVDLIKYLIENYSEHYQACIFEVNGKTEALIGIYHQNILPEIEEQIRKKDYKLQNLLQKSVARKINADIFAANFININTKENLEKVLNLIIKV